MPTPQAEALTKEQNELLSYQFEQLATKSDVKQVQAEIKHLAENTQTDIKHLAENTQADIKNLEGKLDTKFQSLQAEIKHLAENSQADLELRLARLQLQLMLAFFGGLTTSVGIVLSAIKLML